MFKKIVHFIRSQSALKNAAGLLALCFCLLGQAVEAQPTPFADPKFWIPDGPVNAILMTNDTIYFGGDFSYVGPRTGPTISFNQLDGKLQAYPPQIGGIVKAVVPDGSGGWFIGGAFTNIGAAPVTNIARLNANLALDTSWNARMVGTTVNALALDSGRLYVGGTFSRVGGQQISGLAGLNAETAKPEWNPLLAGSVNALQVGGGLVYAGGSFFSVGDSNRVNLVAISITTAQATAWNPAPDAQVFAMSLTASNLYVGGQFSNIGTKAKNDLAAVDLKTGIATSWQPNPNGVVRALLVTATNAYVGGDFTTISVAARRGFASVGLTGTGAARPLDLQLQSVGTANLVRTILLAGNSLYVGGQFTGALGGSQPLVVGIDIVSGNTLPTPLGTTFNGSPGTAFGVNALAANNGAVLAGGDFFSLGGVARGRAAALSITTGAALPWSPTFSKPVLALAYGTGKVYVGGSFTNLNNTNTVSGLGVVDAINGDRVAYNFSASNAFSFVTISSLVLSPNALYVGGAFTTVSDLPRRLLAAVDPATAAVIPAFDAKLGGGFSGVNALARSGDSLYVAGDFKTVNATNNPRLAAVSATSGANLGWNPAPNQLVSSLSVTSDTLSVGGQFSIIDGITLRNFAAFSTADNSLVPLDIALPTFAGGVNAIGATPTAVYIGGSFSAVGGEFRQNLAVLNPLDATAFDWNPSPDVPPTVITVSDDLVALGGTFRFLGQNPTNRVNPFLAIFHRGAQLVATIAGPDLLQINTTTGDRTTAILQSAPSLGSTVWTDVATNALPGFPWSVTVPQTGVQQIFRTVAE